MNSILDLLLYVPITLVILSVLEACKQDDPKKIVRRTALNFGALTAVLLIGCVVIFFVNKYF
ncbi:MAG: hypothetical protein HYY17_07930 [Planctomycetes bacterium]|nr:hypothetical protein [Planctomycetota bacterium]